MLSKRAGSAFKTRSRGPAQERLEKAQGAPSTGMRLPGKARSAVFLKPVHLEGKTLMHWVLI